MKLIDKLLEQKPDEIIDFIIDKYCPCDFGMPNHDFCEHGANCKECWNQEVKND